MNFILSSLWTGKAFDRQKHQEMIDEQLAGVRGLIQNWSEQERIRESLQVLISPCLFVLQSECEGNSAMTQLIAAEWERRAKENGKSLS